jgi:hypothetical protein
MQPVTSIACILIRHPNASSFLLIIPLQQRTLKKILLCNKKNQIKNWDIKECLKSMVL